jgi:hypothetical protein
MGWRGLVLGVWLWSPLASAYSVLTHQAVIDSLWDTSIQPLLLARFPHATTEDLRKAHAYAYGGAIVQDFGYYPFGSRLFTDLVHYFRSGDFIENLLAESADLNEFAFALGSLAHYASDNSGHRIAVNRAVPLMYPKLARRFGPVVTYEDNPSAHLKVEFAFDVAQVARHRYAPEAYHDFIGFEVAKSVLERAFRKTYGLPLKDFFASIDLAIGSYRFAVASLIPKMTKAAWAAREKELSAAPGLTRQKFLYNLSGQAFEKEWGMEYERPGRVARLLAFFFRILPKVGPLKVFAFHMPAPEAERLFMQSFNATLDLYRKELTELGSARAARVPNRNFDTGGPAVAGQYHLADEACEQLLAKLARNGLADVDAPLRKAVLAFYARTPPKKPEAADVLRRLQQRPERAAAR